MVVAEDGVTSLRYFLSIFRAPGRANSSRQAPPEPEVSSALCRRCDALLLGCLTAVAATTVAMSRLQHASMGIMTCASSALSHHLCQQRASCAGTVLHTAVYCSQFTLCPAVLRTTAHGPWMAMPLQAAPPAHLPGWACCRAAVAARPPRRRTRWWSSGLTASAPRLRGSQVRRQAGCCGGILGQQQVISQVARAEVKPSSGSPGVRCILELSAASSGGFKVQ